MKPVLSTAVLLICMYAALNGQSIQPPCTLNARASIGICIDFFCIPAFGYAEGGTPPYQYQWFNGAKTQNTSLDYGSDPTGLDTCLTLRVTDAKGCVADASTRYIYSTTPLPPHFIPDSNFVKRDTLLLTNGTKTFDLGANDHPFAQDYTLVQAPKHGNLILNADGTGVYIADPDWCGPDNFRYTAADTSHCHFGKMATVLVYPTACAGIVTEKVDCNQQCQATAIFYQNGVLTPPLNYLWSNGNTTEEATHLCAGIVSVTVTDALGVVQTFQKDIKSDDIEVSISGPAKVCNQSMIALASSVTMQNAGNYKLYWSGSGFYSDLAYMPNPKIYCSTTGDSIYYQLLAYKDNGCSDTARYGVKVMKQLSIDLLTTVPKCPGDTLLMKPKFNVSGTGPYTYIWSGPAGVQSNWPELRVPDAGSQHSGFYNVTVSDVNGCTSGRNANILIPDTCAYKVVIIKESDSYCSGSDMVLQYGMSPNYLAPDEVHWSGPNGFFSNKIQPVISQVTSNHSGWYHLTVRIGSNILRDSVLIVVKTDDLTVLDVGIQAPSACISPYDGKLTLNLSVSPPYQAKLDYNNFQNFNTAPLVLNGISSGPHMVTVKKNGCLSVENLVVPTPDAPQILSTDESCIGNDGSISINSPHPLTVSWVLPNGNFLNNNQLNLTNATTGTYKIFVKDQVTNCQFRDTISLLPYLDFSFSVIDTPDCTSADGKLLGIPNAGTTGPVNYQWSNGLIINPATGLATGGYSLTLTDGDGCFKHKNTVLPARDACIAQVTGYVYANLNCTCSKDSTTVAFPFTKVCATSSAAKVCTYVTNTGEYNLGLTEPGQYAISASSYLPGIQGICTEHTFVVGNDLTQDASGLNFYFCGSPETDLALTGHCEPARPGFDFYAAFRLTNNGFYSSDSNLVNIQISPFIENPVFSPLPWTYDPVTRLARWKTGKMQLFQQYKIEIRGMIIGNLGDTLLLDAEAISLKNTDNYLNNNTYACSRIISGSFDPNDKSVEPPGVGNPGRISKTDSVLTYTIRFQNTGTDTAFTVVIRDTLDSDLFDLNSIRPDFSSHPFQLDIERGNILVFTFPNINLPDSNRTVAGSQGFVKFSINLLPDLSIGTVIANSAAIYFDYNAPVITNTVQNAITPVRTPDRDPVFMTLLPNPVSDLSWLRLSCPEGTEWLSVVLLDVSGQFRAKLFERRSAHEDLQIPIKTQDLSSGLYFVHVRSNLGQKTGRLLVLKP